MKTGEKEPKRGGRSKSSNYTKGDRGNLWMGGKDGRCNFNAKKQPWNNKVTAG